MTQKIDPFIKLNWGWDTGEGGWGEGMNQNLIIHAFLQSKRINNILASASLLPVTPVDGDAYFAEDDETLYIRAEGSWYTLQPTVGMLFILKTTEAVVKYNGTTLVSDTKTISEVVGLQGALDGKVSSVLVGASSGVAPLGVDGKVPASYLPASGSYLGTWDASINSPTITSGVGSSGEFYKVSVGGSVVIDGTGSWTTGDEIRFNGTIWQRIPNTNLVASVNGYTGTVVLNASDVGAAATSHTHSNATTTVGGFMSSTDKVKLNGVATGATANSTDATLLNRANHTGTQSQSTITNLTTDLSAKQDLLVNTVNIKSVNGTSLLGAGNIVVSSGGSTTFTGLTDTPATYTGQALKFTRINSGETALEFVSLGSAAYSNSGDFANSSHTHANATTTVSGFMSNVDKVKLDTIATGATANSSDATLLARANHTGTQTSLTISDFNSAVDARVVSGIVGKENTIVAGTTAQYWRGDKSWQALDKAAVGLSNVDNTSDASKNTATATLTNKTISGLNNTLTNISQSSVSGLVTDLGLKAPSASPTFTGSVVLPVTTSIGSVGGTEISYLSGVSSGIQAQLNNKVGLDGSSAWAQVKLYSNSYAGQGIEILGSRNADSNPTFQSRIGLGFWQNTGSPTNGQTVGMIAFGGQHGTETSLTPANLAYAASIKGVSESPWVSSSNMGTGIAFYTGVLGEDLRGPNHSYGTERLRITSAGEVQCKGDLRVDESSTFIGSVVLPPTTSIGPVSNTEISYLSGVSSGIQAQLNSKQTSLGFTPVNKAGDTGVGALSASSLSGGSVSSDTGFKTTAFSLNVRNPIWRFGNLDTHGFSWFSDASGLGGVNTLGIHFGTATAAGSSVRITPNSLDVQGSGVFSGGVINGVGASTTQPSVVAAVAGDYYSTPTYAGLHLFHYNSGVTGDVIAGVPKANCDALVSQNSSNLVITTNAGNSIYIGAGGLQSIVAAHTGQLTFNGNTNFTGHINVGTINVDEMNVSGHNIKSTSSGFLDITSTDSAYSGINLYNSLDVYRGAVYADNSGVHIATSAGGSLTIANSGDATFTDDVKIDGALVVDGNSTFTNNVNCGWTFDCNGPATFTDDVNITGSLTVGGVSVALVSNTVSKATPSQLFQNIGTVSGVVSVNGSNGLHILATVNGNTTWIFPTPSATEALALTLELTNGGAYTMTWPSGIRWAGGVAIPLTVSGTDVLVFTKAGTNNWRGYLSSKDSK